MSEESKNCTAPEARQFDFWLGEWDLTWGKNGQGTNRIERILGGCVIQENFEAAPAAAYAGMSMSTYDAESEQWKQTWVDSQGLYLDFAGGFDDERMILNRDTAIKGEPVKQRMVWYDIEPDKIEWNWQRSKDGGQSWEIVWHIHYIRKA